MMEELENRFEIIRIAAILADYETIDVQIRHLRNLSTDKHLHVILQDLENKNFRQAFFLMQEYFKTLQDDFFDPSSQKSSPEMPSSDAPMPPQESSDLFSTSSSTPTSTGERILGLEEMLRMTKESASDPRRYDEAPVHREPEVFEQEVEKKTEKPVVVSTPSTKADPLFTLDQDIPHKDVSETPVVDSAEVATPLPPSESEAVSSADAPEMTPLFGGGEELEDEALIPFPMPDEHESETELVEPEADNQAKDLFASDMFAADEFTPLFADNEPNVSGSEPSAPQFSEDESIVPKTTPAYSEKQSSMTETPQTVSSSPIQEKVSAPDAAFESTDRELESEEAAHDPEESPHPRRWEVEPDNEDVYYTKFAYMGQKFRNMMHQFPQLEEHEEGVVEEVRDFIHMVSTRDYAESQVEAAIQRYQELKELGHRAEAAQMLIAAATTESTFAQFMLARELFKGDVLKQNYPESFTQINSLAEEDYPEAICDLGQLYEYGIGIDKNKRHALLLYEEAAEMGVERARRHYERLKNTNPLQSIKSLTSSLLRKKKK
jgi:hypothetical protein